MSSTCHKCDDLGHGICLDNTTCTCFDGWLGPTCADPVTTIRSQSATPLSPLNIGAIIAGVLGGVLLTLIIGFIAFYLWRRRSKKASAQFNPTNLTATTSNGCEPVVVPALYDISSSRRYSSAPSFETITYHLYEELEE